MRGGISFSNPPGVKYEYSNFGFGILGRIVSNVSGMPYQQYIVGNILEPLGMTSSTYDIRQVAPERYAMGYDFVDDQWVEVPPLNDGEFGSMGGLFTTINDFARYIAYLLTAFPPRDDVESGPVRRSSRREMMQLYSQRNVSSSRQPPDSPTLVSSDGYGFGLVAGVDSVLGYSVSHGGGLPGYGTFYRLLPEHGVGIVTFTNLTYMPAAVPINEVYAVLKKTGGLNRRIIPPAAPLVAVQEAIAHLYDRWDDDEMKSISTESLFLDLSLEKRRAEFEDLRVNFGERLSVTPIQAENALRGSWHMKCKGGSIEISVTLSPTVPPLVQHLEFTAAKPLGQSLKRAITAMTHLIGQWDETQAQNLFVRSLKRKSLQAQFEALRVQYGDLKLGDVLEGDGKTKTSVRLLGSRGSVDMHISIKSGSKRVQAVSFTRPQETAFVP
ncbi:MAG: beta-lactamase family protein, partial [Burkholderiales bacterium]|nr:beta-lactamase family protein [Anaerolineae bacterium]